jgi:hypothetical protein
METQVILIIVGIFLIGLGIFFFFARKKSQTTLFNIKATQTLKTKDITDLCDAVKEDLGPGCFNRVLEVKGIVKCDNPLVGELSKQKCVYYSMKVSHEYEETYTIRNSQGRTEKRTRRGSETISSNSQSVHFYVEDDTGKILVNPASATLHTIKAVDRFESSAGNNSSTIKFGSLSFNIPSNSSGRRSLGYRYVEEIIPVERRIYVLGEASDATGELMIQLPNDKKESFIVSLKSEEELIKLTESSIVWYLVGAITSIVIGILLLVFSSSIPNLE